jgi:acetyl-CoA acetyltransferase
MVLDDAVIVSIGETEKRRPDEDEPYDSLEEYYQQAAHETLEDADIPRDEVDGFGTITPSTVDIPLVWPTAIGEVLGLGDLEWITSTDHGGASAVSLLIQAATAVNAGHVDSILCLGADTPMDPTEEMFTPYDIQRGFVWNYIDPFGNQGPNDRLALAQSAYVDAYGPVEEQLAEIAVTQREHALANPEAYFDDPLIVEEYLNAPMISDPIRMYDAVIPVNAGFGFLVMRRDEAESRGLEYVTVDGFGQCHNPELVERPDPTTTGVDRAVAQAVDRAGIAAEDADFYQVYDDYPIVVLMQFEDLGLCEKGEGASFVAAHDLSYDGDVPLNTGGGQLSAGQAAAAGGFVQLLEGVRQLRHEGGDRQVPRADRGIVTGVGGLSYDKNVQNNAVVVLGRGDADDGGVRS